MAGGCFQKMITFLAAGLLIMMLAVNLSEATLGTDCTSFGDSDCNTQGANNEVCTATVCACDTEFSNNAGACDLDCTVAPTAPTYGTVSISGVIATFACNSGYTVTGSATQTCTSAAWIGSAPTCVLSCTGPTAPTDGTVSVSGVTVTYSCNAEYTVSSPATRTCASSTWSGTAPTCTLGCPTLSDPADGTVSVSGVTGTYTCNTEYTLSHSTAQTCSTPTWSGSAPTCTFDCTVVLANPADGTVSVSGVTATYTCNTGFTVTGGPTQTCSTGTWGGIAATCVLACTGLSTPLHGAVSISANVATFTCDEGYTPSGFTLLICTTTWSGSAPTCSQNSGVGGPGVSNSLVGIIITCLLTALAM